MYNTFYIRVSEGTQFNFGYKTYFADVKVIEDHMQDNSSYLCDIFTVLLQVACMHTCVAYQHKRLWHT